MPDHTGQEVSLSDFSGSRLLIAFYPLDFSPICNDQLIAYKAISDQLKEAGVTLVGISVDSAFAHKAFRADTGIDNSLLADFEPKGAVASAYGAYLQDYGHANRSLVLIDGDGVVEWSTRPPRHSRFRLPASSSKRSERRTLAGLDRSGS